jgi:creatinine amidohydrolase/Fe(II)-dependent formamide hydrolase-like protein
VPQHGQPSNSHLALPGTVSQVNQAVATRKVSRCRSLVPQHGQPSNSHLALPGTVSQVNQAIATRKLSRGRSLVSQGSSKMTAAVK